MANTQVARTQVEWSQVVPRNACSQPSEPAGYGRLHPALGPDEMEGLRGTGRRRARDGRRRLPVPSRRTPGQVPAHVGRGRNRNRGLADRPGTQQNGRVSPHRLQRSPDHHVPTHPGPPRARQFSGPPRPALPSAKTSGWSASALACSWSTSRRPRRLRVIREINGQTMNGQK